MRLHLLGYGLVALAALFSPALFAEPWTYSAKEIRGQVVDDETGTPLEGVVIVAQWELIREVRGFNRDTGEALKVIEVVTDKDGKYLIPGWGPVPRTPMTHLEEKDPSLQFFKPGHYPRGLANEIRSPEKHNTSSVRTSRWDGVVLRLRRFTGKPQDYKQFNGYGDIPTKVDGTLKEYVDLIGIIQTSLHCWGGGYDNYNWKLMPHMVIALKKEKERLAKEGMNPNELASIGSISSLYGGRKMVEEFLKEFEQ